MTFLRDVATSFNREMKPTLAGPSWMAFGLVQPLLYLAFFVPLLDVGGIDAGRRCSGSCPA